MASRGSSRAAASVGAAYTGMRRYTSASPGCPDSRQVSRYVFRWPRSRGMSRSRSPMKSGRPRRATCGKVSGELAAMRSGGCGTWYGVGDTVTSRTR